MSETAVMEIMRKHFAMVGAYKFDDAVKAPETESLDWIEDGDIMLTFLILACTCGYAVLPPLKYDWKESKMVSGDERLQERYDQGTFSPARFRPTEAWFNCVRLKVKEVGLAIMWFGKVLELR